MEIVDRPGLDDPIWDYLLKTRLQPYIEPARNWWDTADSILITDTGVYELEGPPGFMMRFTRTAVRSPIKGVQAFPFVPVAYLQITGIQGGANKMVERTCLNNKCTFEEFTIVAKSNLPTTYNQGQIVAFIPTILMEERIELGNWLYLTPEELHILYESKDIPPSVKQKIMLKM
jgi:hypothetical protein